MLVSEVNFLVEKNESSLMGAPIFIFDQGSYLKENNVMIGCRKLFLGIMVNKENELISVSQSTCLDKIIKEKFNLKLIIKKHLTKC